MTRGIISLAVVGLLMLQQVAFVFAADDKRRTAKDALISDGVVISQVYGGGGNSGATYTHDFIELFNRGSSPVNIGGWSLQYASATGTGNFGANTGQITELPSVTIQPGQYYLVQESGGTTGSPLPTADHIDTTPINMSGASGKVALANIAVSLGCNGGSTACNSTQLSQIVDLVGYGSANFFEGAGAAPTLSNTTAALRNGSGCSETDNNNADFGSALPNPRNTSTPLSPCTAGPTDPSGVGLASPSSVLPGGSTLLTVTVTPGTNPASTGLAVSSDLSLIGGSATQTFFDNGTNGDVTAGDNIFSFETTVSLGTSVGEKIMPVSITDAQARSGNTTISVTVTSATTSPSGVGSANPGSVDPGESSLLTVTVTPGSNPASTGLSVAADLSSIGGSGSQQFFDDGTNGDTTIGDNIFSYNATVDPGTAPGNKSLPVTITDAQARMGNTSISLSVTLPSGPGQPLPFIQDWSNTGLITTDNDWSNVPGIVGYRGDAMTGGTAVDPQTVLQDGSATPVQVYANNTNPNTSTSGGVGEFELANPVVGFQGSGTSRAPHIVISINTVGASNVTASYDLRDVDGSGDNSVQPVALQYRVGNAGNFTNIPAAFVADASSGPNQATLVTNVGVLLPAAVENHPLVQLRIITTDAVGSDEWIGVDDIVIASNGTLPLSASGSASPNLVNAGSSTLLTVSVNPATNPISTGLSVTGDLISVGGSPAQQFFDDGTNGDIVPGDLVFSYSAPIPPGASGGPRSLPVNVVDDQARMAATSIALTVRAAPDPLLHLTMGNPSNAVQDVNVPENYLILRDQYSMAYNRDRGTPNWVAWHLDTSWIGSTPRQDDFRPDTSLPAGWYQVTEFDYSGSGFDRGHHCPSGDRTATVADNSATFFMTNMMPQAPDNNQGPWEALESQSRSFANQGNELYIFMGGVGMGGSGSNGGITNTVAGGNVVVPSYTWKVIMLLPNGTDDVSRVDENTRAIAVIMPNNQGIRTDPWQKYLATVDQVEALTGYDFFSNVPEQIQAVIESRLDPASNTAPQSVGGGTFTDLVIDAPNTTMTGNITVNGNLRLGGSTLRTVTNTITLGPNATVTRISGFVDGSLQKQFNSTGSFQYPVGTQMGFSPVSAEITNLGVNPSSLTVRSVDGPHPQAPVPFGALRRYWSLSETGDLTANISFNYLQRDVPIRVLDETSFRLQRFDGSFTEFPSTIDPDANFATGTGISDFSDWTLFGQFVPTAANVSVSGKVVDANGRGVANSLVTLTATDGSIVSAWANNFGYFSVESVRSGEGYLLQVRHREIIFNPQFVQVADEVSGLVIRGLP